MSRRPENADALLALGDRLRQTRRGAGISQEQLAERVNADSVTISRLETGRHALTVPMALRIAVALGVPVSVLVDVQLPLPPADPDAMAQAEWLSAWSRLDAQKRSLVIRLVREIERG